MLLLLSGLLSLHATSHHDVSYYESLDGIVLGCSIYENRNIRLESSTALYPGFMPIDTAGFVYAK